jgi:ribonucleoside-diphosphate reductase alpha chain
MSGNASVILGTSSGIHPAHSRNYFRVMQINKDSGVARWLAENRPDMIEESVWSASKSDYVVYVPITESPDAIVKSDISSIEHLEKVKLAQDSWVLPGTIKGRGYSDTITHNISNTIVVDDWDETFQYVWDNREYFCGISFLPKTGDKIYRQAPFTSVLMADELLAKYGDGAMFASGLIVDILHAFDNDLWTACDAILDKGFFLSGAHLQVLQKKDVIRRAKKYAKNYFKNELSVLIECLKDIHLFHKWCNITRKSIDINVSKVLGKPSYLNIDEMSAIACHGGSCEI